MKCKKIKHFEGLIRNFHTLPTKVKKTIIANIDPVLLKLICEFCQNVLQRNVPLTKEKFSKLKKYKLLVKDLANKSVADRKKVLKLKGSGFFIPLLFSVITPLLSKLIGG